MKQTFKVPIWPPSTNRIWRNVRVCGKQRTLLSKEARSFYRHAANFIRSPPAPITGRVQVHIDMHTPHHQPYDVDNRIKAVLDLLTKCGVWVDDKQVTKLSVEKHPKAPHAMIIITVTPLETMKTNGNEQTEAHPKENKG